MLAHCDTIHLQRLYCPSSADALRVFTSAALEGKLPGGEILIKLLLLFFSTLYYRASNEILGW
jgi:hypothetical protein